MIPGRFNSRSLLFALKHPSVFLGELHRLGIGLNQRYYESKEDNNGKHIWEKDWENLILLDGCRFDTYERCAPEGGSLSVHRSRASESKSFMEENFENRDLHDVVYVTSNPYASQIQKGTFHKKINLIDEGWDEELQTVSPEIVTETAKKTYRDFPEKRIIIHYMQPHYPFLGPTGNKLDHVGIKASKDSVEPKHIWKRLQYGLENQEKVKKAYRENLNIVLKHVTELLEELSGKTVISADHGNLFGETTSPIPAKGYGHPPQLLVSGLTDVPWHEFNKGNSRSITSDPPKEDITEPEIEDGTVQNRLEDLGYL